MNAKPTDGTVAALGRGVAAGVAGTGVMTAFQLLVEMPLTGRAESFAPAAFAERVLPIGKKRGRGRRRLNYAAHFAIGAGWGAAHGLAERSGLRGQAAVATVFGTVYVGDALLNTALGLYRPWDWTSQEWAVDVLDKLVLAEATGFLYGRLTRA